MNSQNKTSHDILLNHHSKSTRGKSKVEVLTEVKEKLSKLKDDVFLRKCKKVVLRKWCSEVFLRKCVLKDMVRTLEDTMKILPMFFKKQML